jgi:hypothetical protein
MKLIRCCLVLDSDDRYMFETSGGVRGIDHARAIALRCEQLYRNSPHVTLPLRLFAVDALGDRIEIPLAGSES